MAKIAVLATMAAALQLAGTLTEPDCPVMESGFVYLSNRARDFARLSCFYWTPEGKTALGGFIGLCRLQQRMYLCKLHKLIRCLPTMYTVSLTFGFMVKQFFNCLKHL